MPGTLSGVPGAISGPQQPFNFGKHAIVILCSTTTHPIKKKAGKIASPLLSSLGHFYFTDVSEPSHIFFSEELVFLLSANAPVCLPGNTSSFSVARQHSGLFTRHCFRIDKVPAHLGDIIASLKQTHTNG